MLAFYAFPAEHWPKLRSTNPLERFNREIGRRTDVVGIFPDDASVIRLVTMLAIEANDEWLVGRSYISQQSMATLYTPAADLEQHTEEEEAGLIAAWAANPITDDASVELLHHAPGLDSEVAQGSSGWVDVPKRARMSAGRSAKSRKSLRAVSRHAARCADARATVAG